MLYSGKCQNSSREHLEQGKMFNVVHFCPGNGTVLP